MIVIIGAGLTGLLIANEKYQNSVIIEEQPKIGGLYALEDMLEMEITTLPPLLFRECKTLNYFEVEDIELKYRLNKFKYINKKICKECEDIPNYLKIKNKVLYIKNLNILIKKFAKNVKIITGYPIRVGKEYIITNHSQLIKFDMLINTGSLKRISNLLNIPLKLNSIPVYIAIILTTPQKQNYDWDVYIDGDFSVSFSYIYKFEIKEKNLEIYYVYSFLEDIKQPIDIKRIMIDMKRRNIISDERDIIAFRSRLVKDGLLISKSEKIKKEFNKVRNCGRLGGWVNIDLCGVLEEVHEC